MAAAPHMNGATSANGTQAGVNGTATAPTPAGPDRVASAAANLMNATVEEGRKWMAGRDERRPSLSHTSMKAWTVRSLFILFAATMMVSVILLGLGLLGAGEVAVILMPVATLSAAMFGFYFGDSDNH